MYTGKKWMLREKEERTLSYKWATCHVCLSFAEQYSTLLPLYLLWPTVPLQTFGVHACRCDLLPSQLLSQSREGKRMKSKKHLKLSVNLLLWSSLHCIVKHTIVHRSQRENAEGTTAQSHRLQLRTIDLFDWIHFSPAVAFACINMAHQILRVNGFDTVYKCAHLLIHNHLFVSFCADLRSRVSYAGSTLWCWSFWAWCSRSARPSLRIRPSPTPTMWR